MKYLKTAIIVLLILISFLAGYQSRRDPEHLSSPTIERLTAMGRLDVLQLELADVRQSKIAGYSGSSTLLLILRGQVIVGIDLTKATLQRRADGRFALILPPPRVTLARVDNEQSKVYRIDRDGLWQFTPNDHLAVALVNKALIDAQQTMTTAGESQAIVMSARSAAEHLLRQWAVAQNWSVEIVWKDSGAKSPSN